jgi:transposase
MRKLREILRLHFENQLPGRAIARSCKTSPSTVSGYIHRAVVAKLGWPLEKLLFPTEHAPVRTRPEPEWALVHRELQKKHVTKLLVWQEYREAHADGMQYSQFCERYGRWRERLGLVWRRDHKAGERMFVDFSGDGITLVDPLTGECKVAKLFVAVLGASNYTYIEPVLSEDLPDVDPLPRERLRVLRRRPRDRRARITSRAASPSPTTTTRSSTAPTPRSPSTTRRR